MSARTKRSSSPAPTAVAPAAGAVAPVPAAVGAAPAKAPAKAPARADMPAEIELKLAIDPGDVAATAMAVLRHPAVAAVAAGRTRTHHLLNTYFDTPDGELAQAGIAVRVRQDGRHYRQTVKGPPLAGAGGPLQARGEYEWALPGPELDRLLLDDTPWRDALRAIVAAGRLGPRFTTDFRRRVVPLSFSDGTRAELCVDVGEIRASATGARPMSTRSSTRGGVRSRSQPSVVPIAEVEIELAEGSPRRLFDLALALIDTLPLSVIVANKAARGHALAHGKPDGWDRPVRARPTSLSPKAPVAGGLAAIAVECLEHIAANAAGLLHDDDPEWVHQMRVGTRRLRSCLGLERTYFAATDLEPVLTEVRWLATTLGQARDWDVFATSTLPAAAQQFAVFRTSAEDVERLEARVATRRRAARKAARAAIASPRFSRLLLAIAALCASARAGSGVAAGETAAKTERQPTLRAFARDVLRRRHRRLCREARVAIHGSAEQRHALRIAAKKLRYASEFFAPLFDRDQAKAYATALAGVQEVLGHANDAATATRLIPEIVPASGHSPATAALGAWVGATTAAIEPELDAAWRQFRTAKRFWRKD